MRPRSSATAKKFALVVSVRTVVPMRPVEFGAVSSVLIGIIVIRFTGPTGPMAESHSGEPTPIPGGVIADIHAQSFAIHSPLRPSALMINPNFLYEGFLSYTVTRLTLPGGRSSRNWTKST